MGGQFGQQWDEQQFAPMQPAYNYGNPDALPQVLILCPQEAVLIKAV